MPWVGFIEYDQRPEAEPNNCRDPTELADAMSVSCGYYDAEEARNMTHLSDALARNGVTIIYDGECPFCSAYVKMVRLREAAGAVTLINARQTPLLVSELAAKGHVIDREMVVVHNGSLHAGGDAVHVLSLLTSPSGPVNRLLVWLLRDPKRANVLYPYLRSVRNGLLRLLGRGPIG